MDRLKIITRITLVLLTIFAITLIIYTVESKHRDQELILEEIHKDTEKLNKSLQSHLTDIDKAISTLPTSFNTMDSIEIEALSKRVLSHNPLISNLSINLDTLSEGALKPNAEDWVSDTCSSSDGSISLHRRYLIRDNNNRMVGSAICGINLDSLRDRMRQISFRKTGYSVLLLSNGDVIYHPRKILSDNIANIEDVANETDNSSLKEISSLIKSGGAGSIHYKGVYNNRDMISFIKRVENHNIVILSFCIEDEYQNSKINNRWHLLLKILVITITIMVILILWMSLNSQILIAIGTSVTLLISIVISIFLDHNKQEDNLHNSAIITSSSELEQYIHNSEKRINTVTDSSPFIEVPTGIFIQSVQFSSANNFIATGYVWQHYTGRYNPDIDKVILPDSTQISPGVIFPDNEKIEIERSYIKESDNQVVIGWRFNVKIREQFWYSKFPFDTEQFWIRMWHKEFENKIILTPDFSAYENMNPTQIPGVEQNITIPGWVPISSFFNYVENSYNTTFGMPEYSGQYSFPELHFNLTIRRLVLDKFISHFIPLIILLIMLFSILCLGRVKRAKELTGFDALTSVSVCSGLFFVVVFNHINLREELCVSKVVYMEYLYFITYLMILYVTVNSIALASDRKIGIFHYKDNLISRMLFWPVVLGIIYAVTIFQL